MSNILKCQRCGAIYSKDTQWHKGWAIYEGTESAPRDYSPIGFIPKNVCPICELPDESCKAVLA